ncbi:MAG: flavin reductase family protein [Pirellulales bacterium]
MKSDQQSTQAKVQEVFRLVDRELWIVTAADKSRRGGLVATWVAQASLDPESPVLLIALATNHFTAELINASGQFAAHLIHRDQIDLAWRFGLTSGHSHDKLEDLATFEATTGTPILAHCLAWLDCRIITTYDSGDRIFYWADVVDGGRRSEGQPLREQELLTMGSPQQLAQLRQNMQHDIRIQKPMLADWRQRVGFTDP